MSLRTLQLLFLTKDDKFVRCEYESLKHSVVVQNLVLCHDYERGIPPIHLPNIDAKTLTNLFEWVRIHKDTYKSGQKPAHVLHISHIDKEFLQNFKEDEIISLVSAACSFDFRSLVITGIKYLREVEAFRIMTYYRNHGQPKCTPETGCQCNEVQRRKYILPNYADIPLANYEYFDVKCPVASSTKEPIVFKVLPLTENMDSAKTTHEDRIMLSRKSFIENAEKEFKYNSMLDAKQQKNILLATVCGLLASDCYGESIKQIMDAHSNLLKEKFPKYSSEVTSDETKSDSKNCDITNNSPNPTGMNGSLDDLLKENSVNNSQKQYIKLGVGKQMDSCSEQIIKKKESPSGSDECDGGPNGFVAVPQLLSQDIESEDKDILS